MSKNTTVTILDVNGVVVAHYMDSSYGTGKIVQYLGSSQLGDQVPISDLVKIREFTTDNQTWHNVTGGIPDGIPVMLRTVFIDKNGNANGNEE